MGMKVGELYAELGLEDKQFHTKLSGAKKALGGITKVAAAGATAAGAAIAGIGAKGVKEFASFEKGMNEVFTLLPNASKKAMSQMTEDIRKFSVEMGVATNESVPALYQAISAGVPQDNVFDFLETAQKAAVGGVTDLTTAVDGISSVINAYGADVLSAAEASDLMFTAVRLGKTTFEEMAASLYNVIPTASALGVQFEDITAAIASMTAQGTPTAQATTQIRQALNELSSQGSQAAEIFREVAGRSFADFIKQGGNLQEALYLMEQAAKANNVSVKDLFSSVEAGQAALALTGKGAKAFRKNLEEMGESAGATQAAYERMDQSLSRTFDKLKAAIHDVFLEVGEALKPAMEELTNWIRSHMPQIKEIARVAFEKIGDAIMYIVNVVIPKIVEAFNWLKKEIKEFSKDPEKAFKNLKQTAIRIMLELVTEVGKAIMNAIISWSGEMVKAAIDGFYELDAAVTEAIIELGKDMAKAFGQIVNDAKEWGRNIIQGLIDGVTGMISDAVNTVRDAASSITDAAKDALGINSPSKVFEGIGENITAGLEKGIAANQRNLQVQVDAMVNGMIPKTAAVGAGGPQVIHLSANYYGIDQNTAKSANSDLVRKLQGRGLGGSFR